MIVFFKLQKLQQISKTYITSLIYFLIILVIQFVNIRNSFCQNLSAVVTNSKELNFYKAVLSVMSTLSYFLIKINSLFLFNFFKINKYES